MKKTVTVLILWVSDRLHRVAFWLESKDRSADTQSKFVDLAPTDEADKAGVYSEAVLFATKNEKVFNIALTGPYGSGKSSIIQTFLKKYRRPALHISLAAFVPEASVGDESASRQEIERSILQQMLYGADAKRLPLSRFKRIQSPGVWSIFKSLYITLGIFAVWYVFHQREEIINASFFDPLTLSNWLNLGTFVFAATFTWITLHHFYVASFGLSLKSISLKDVEIKPAHDDHASILNRHLDEIVYFFQSTAYDLVIIEDLDRFDNAEIFVTLREINKLVNENSGIKRTIRFLYALRDDMFINTDRTKFFEFIIPVIPIINTSNSIDMVLKQGSRLKLDRRLDRQFLREVSRYLNDMRLIQNIFNEYTVYMACLETDGEELLDANKLLAVLIYKNVYPRDFEKLHRGLGTLAEILNLHGELISSGESTYRTCIAELEKELQVAERQTPSDLRELRQIYAMALIEKLPESTLWVSLDQQVWIALSKLVDHDEFENFIATKRLISRQNNQQRMVIDVSKMQREVDSQKSYCQRRGEIESKTSENKHKSLKQIRDLKSKISTLRTTKLNELLRLNIDRTQNLFDDLGENGDLARFLILEGHLDDTYYQYTSLFHSGRLSPNDNRFLIRIRAFVTPEPGFPIDNPNEVIAAMRDEDFRQSYVLNIKLVDSILSNQSLHLDQTRKFYEFLAAEFEKCEVFFEAYYGSGQHVTELLLGLASVWKGLIPSAIASPNSIIHVTQLLLCLPELSLKTLAKDFDELPEFVSVNLPEILEQSPELAPERLKCLNFEIRDLASIKKHNGVVNLMFEAGLFELTLANLEYAYTAILGEHDLEQLRERNFTTIRSMSNSTLLRRIERDFGRYFSSVLLELDKNSKEDVPAILELIHQNNIDTDNLQEFLEQQTTLLPTLKDVPKRIHALLFRLVRIEPTWVNCRDFMEAEGFEDNSLIDYLEQDGVRSAILQHPLPISSDFTRLRLFIAGAESLSDAAYKEYAEALPKSFNMPPEGLGPGKLKILIDERKIVFSSESLEALAEKMELKVRFVAANIDAYLADPNKFTLDDDFLEKLLLSGADNEAKLRLIELMNLEAVVDLPERAAIIGSIVESAGGKVPCISGTVAQSLILHATIASTKISLFNEYHSLMSESEVRHVLANLPKPFSDIKIGYKQPKLKNTPENRSLASWLDSRNIISSWSEGSLFTDDIKIYLRRY